jgi:catechol 2,3-dioxygenase-like lactoylglutathione lyase family enzyme
MNAIDVTRLAHVDVAVTDLDRSSEFYNDRWGLDLVEEHDGRRYFRSNTSDFHTLSIVQGEPELQHLSLEVSSRDELKRAEAVLEAAGAQVDLPYTEGFKPGVGASLRFRDPNGLVVELVADVEQRREGYGMRDVKPQGLNHAVLRVTKYEETKRFYADVLGFRLSDETENLMAFMRCNVNHHSLAFVNSDRANLHHIAYTVEDWSALAVGIKTLGDAGVCRIWGPGRHGPGDNVFSYYQDPDGHVVEYTCEIQQITDEAAWVPKVWQRGRPEKWAGFGPPAVLR